jgi:hypothetical protein
MKNIDEFCQQIEAIRIGVCAAIQPTLSYLRRLFLTMSIMFIGVVTYLSLTNERDSTDFAEGPRSGMNLHTDALTGCQYLSFPSGGATPRLTITGKQLGCHH